jgi:hypothetical protein
MREEARADSLALRRGSNIGVADEGDGALRVVDVLRAHDPDELAVSLVAVEEDAVIDLVLQLVVRHVGIAEAICGDVASVGGGAIVDCGPDGFKVTVVT